MAMQYQEAKDLLQETLERISASEQEWMTFLDTAARFYKYPFAQQVLIYAQRPEATACAGYAFWKSRMGRQVKRGSKGIALLDETMDRLQYVFDLSDTAGKTLPYQWQCQSSAQEQAIVRQWQETYGIAAGSLPEAVRELVGQYQQEAEGDPEDSPGHTEEAGTLLSHTMTYLILARCGSAREQIRPLVDFTGISTLQQNHALQYLGTEASTAAKEVLLQAGTAIRTHTLANKDSQKGLAAASHMEYNALKRESKKEERGTEHETGIPNERGLSVPEPAKQRAAGRRSGTVREDASGVPEERAEQTEAVRGSVLRAEAESVPDGHRPERPGTDGADRDAADAGAGPDGSFERRTPDGVAPQMQPDSAHRRGDRAERDRIQLKDPQAKESHQSQSGDGGILPVWENPILEQEEEAAEQLSMPLGGRSLQQKEAEQGPEQQDAGASRKPAAPSRKTARAQLDMQMPAEPVPREVLDLLLAAGPADPAGLRQIYFQYQTEPDRKRRAAFLRETYGQGGMGFTAFGREYALWHDREGLTVCRGRSARYEPDSLHLSWEEAEKQIETLVLQGRYLQAEDRDQVRETVLSHTATRLCYLARDLQGDAVQQGMLSCLTDLRTGFPKWEELVQSLLVDPKALSVVTEELERFREAYEANRGILRFHSHDPKELLRMLRLLAKEPEDYPLSDAYQRIAAAFVTEDEVDAVLMQGGVYTDSQWDTYVYFRTHEERAQRQTYLREQFGIGGQSSATYSRDYGSKGVSLTRSYDGKAYDAVHRTWAAAEKRVTELIQKGQYLQGASQADYAAYSRRTLAQEVFQLLHWLPPAAQSGTPEAARWEELVPILERAEPAGELHQKILDAFPYLPRDASGYEFCAHVLQDLTEYVNGSYGPLAEFPAVTPQDWEPELDAQQIRAALEEAIRLEAEEEQEEPIPANSQPLATEQPEAAESEAENRSMQQTEARPEEHEPAKALAPEPEGEQGKPQAEEVQPPAASEPAEEPRKGAPEAEAPANSVAEPEQPPQNIPITKEPPVRTPKETLQDNLTAIQVLKALEAEGRTASESEQAILSRYAGWGGLSQALEETGPWKNEREALQELLTKEEYESAKGSTLNAHYTPQVLIRAMYRAVEQMGFQSGNLLEPSCGVGRFFGLLPDSMRGSRLYGVELDSLSGRMAQKLYPEADIRVQGFEETDFPDQFFDLVIGNVPFGSYQVADRRYDKHHLRIHDYFIAKSLDQLRPGGLAVLITTKGTLDKATSKARAYFAERADLAGAIRLPTAAFRSAGTSVTCDILFFQKRERQQGRDADWLHVEPGEDGIPINRYFQQHPEMILGKMQETSGPFGREYACILEDEAALQPLLEEAIQKLQPDLLREPLPEEPEEGLEPGETPEEGIPASPEVRNFSYALVGEDLYYREHSRMRRCQAEGTARERILGMIEIRDAARQVLTLQLQDGTEEEIRQAQQELEQRYDAYTGQYGLLNSRGNKLAFQEDDSYPLLCSLEELDEDGGLRRKADLFYKRTIARAEVMTHTDTAADALAVSLSERAGVDLELMETLCGRSREDLLAELKGVIFCDPVSGSYETADAYLSGNVRQKLEQAQAAAETDAAWQGNVEALQAVQPKPLTAAEIEVRLGATWLAPSYITEFMKEVFQTPQAHLAQETIAVSYSPHTGNWNVSGKSADRSVYATVTYGTKRASAYRLLEDSLNLRNVQIFDTVLDEEGREKRVLNKKETVLASQKQEQIRQAFSDWIWKDPERRAALCDTYNRRFNAYVPRTFSGEHLTFPGMNPEIELRPHQKDAVARQLYGGNTLLAHCVGAGKTFTMAAAAMESKRIGLSSKSLFVVPNHLTTQWAAEFLRLYPAAKVLAAAKQDFTPGNRKQFCSRISTGDYDAVIIGHSQFERVPLSKERQEVFLADQIETITMELEEARERDGQGAFTVKQMAQQKKQLEQRLKRLHDASGKDTVVTFEELGVDRLFVDEAHAYKNCAKRCRIRYV